MNVTYDEKLAQVNGVVVAAKVPPGEQLKIVNIGALKAAHVKACCICGLVFMQTSNIRLHFVKCVGRYGNPTGAQWNDALDLDEDHDSSPSKSTGPHYPVREQRRRDIRLPIDLIPYPQAAPVAVQGPMKLVMERFYTEVNIESGTRQLVSAAGTLPIGPLPAAVLDPELREHDASSGHATDSELIEVLKMWQEKVDLGHGDQVMNDEKFHGLMDELRARNLVDGAGCWLVNMEAYKMIREASR